MALKKSLKKKTSKKKSLKNFGKRQSKTFSKENLQVVWFLLIILVAFAAFLVPYFLIQNSKTFEFVGATWAKENYNGLEVYHGRFNSLGDFTNIHNIFLRTDPRKNDVSFEGEFGDFKYGGIIAFSREANSCRGPLARSMTDLSSFLKDGMGVEEVIPAAYTLSYSADSGLPYASCNLNDVNTIVTVVLDGEEENGKIFQDLENPSCYHIRVSSCQDTLPVEQFMIRALEDTKDLRIGQE